MSDKIDTARSLLIKNLPTTLHTEPEDSFNEAIYELLDKTFCVDKDAVESIVRFQELDGDAKEFACKCVVTFRSRVLKHRAIAYKSKLEAPTQMESITEVPEGLMQPEELKDLKVQPEGLKGQDTPKQGDAVPKAEVSCDEPAIDTAALTEASVGATTVCEQSHAESVGVQQSQPHLIADDDNKCTQLKMASASSNEGVTLQQIDSVGSDKDESEMVEDAEVILLSDSAMTDDEGLSILSMHESDEHITDHKEVADATNSNINLPLLAHVDRHTQEHFMTLPINWDGAPEFQWKFAGTADDSCKFIFENITHGDLLSPWLYSLVVRAQSVVTNFKRPFGDEMVSDSTGSVQLIFPDDHTIFYHTINYLVYLRSTNRRRIKILLPQTSTMRTNREELQVRLGRKREPTLVMKQLAVKPLPEHITEQHIRNSAFKNFPVDSVEFKEDAANQRVAVVTFPSAEMAIAAHSQNNYVRVGNSADSSDKWLKVLYVDASLRTWGSSLEDHLLTRSESKKFRGTKNKQKRAARMRIDAMNQSEKTGGADVTMTKPATKQTSHKQAVIKTQPSPNAPNPFKKPWSWTGKAEQKQQSSQIAHAKNAQKRGNPQSTGTFPKKARHGANAMRNRASQRGGKVGMMRNAHSSNATRPMKAFRGAGPRNVPELYPRYGETSAFPSARAFATSGMDRFGGLPRGGRDPRAFGQSPAFAEKEHFLDGLNTPHRRVMDMALYDTAYSPNGADAVSFGGGRVPSAVPEPRMMRDDTPIRRPLPSEMDTRRVTSWLDQDNRVGFPDDRSAESGFFFGGAWR